MNKLVERAKNNLNNEVRTSDLIDQLETRHPAEVAADFIEIAVGDTDAELCQRTKREQGRVLAQHLREIVR